MKVKIKRCTDPAMWYKNEIGNTFTVVSDFKSGDGTWYHIIENPDKRSTTKFLVEFNDCEKVFT